MKLISFILLIVLSTSCLTVKRIEKNCDKFAKVCITDTETKVVYRDTIIYKNRIVKVKLPGDTVRIVDTIRIINNRAYLPTRYQRFGIIGVEAGVNNSILKVKAFLRDSSLLIPIHDTIRIENAVQQTTTDNTIVLPPEKYVSKFSKFTHWFFVVSILIIFGIGYMKFKTLGINGIIGKIIKK